MKKGLFAFCLFFQSFLVSFEGFPAEPAVPFFSNLKHSETNVRFGPGDQFPIKFKLKYARLPIQVMKVLKEWYLIHDFEGESGWIHKRMSARNDFVFLTRPSLLKSKNKTIARLSQGVIVKLKSCKNGVCQVQILNQGKKISGDLPAKDLWGHEKLKDS